MHTDWSSSDVCGTEGVPGVEISYQRVDDTDRPGAAISKIVQMTLHDIRSGNSGRRCFQKLDSFFQLTARGSTISQEIWAGCISFTAMSYGMLVIPVLVDKANPSMVPFESLLTATALSAAIGTFLVGMVGNAPVAVIPGLRLNAYMTFGLCSTLGISLGEALSACFVSGALLLILSVLGVCNWIARAVLTDHLKKAIAVAMGIFQATIGFQMMGLLAKEPDDVVTEANLNSSDVGMCLAIVVFCIVSGILVSARLNGALLLSISLIAVGSWVSGIFQPPESIFSSPSFESVLTLDFSGWFRKGKLGVMMVGSLVMLFIALFDIAGVQYGLYSIAGLLRHGAVPLSNQQYASVGIGTMAAALLGVGPLIIANESSAGIMDGARTGMSSLVVAALFVMSAFTTPLLSSIPDLAAAAPLIIIGVFMMEPSRSIAWDNLRVAIPSFLTITLVPHSIHNGIIAGIIADVLLGLTVTLRAARLSQAPEGRDTEERLQPDRQEAPGSANVDANGASQSSSAKVWSGSSVKDKRFWTPHSFSQMTIGLKDAEKVERVRELLYDLGPPNLGSQASDTWEIALRRALETYLDGMHPVAKPLAQSRRGRRGGAPVQAEGAPSDCG